MFPSKFRLQNNENFLEKTTAFGKIQWCDSENGEMRNYQ